MLELAAKIFRAPFVPVLAASPGLGRYCVFGNLFARFGIGSDGPIHRLDRHPSASRHPVTPMKEADLRRHLARQTRRRIALFDILQLALPEREARTALNKILEGKPDAVLFDALYPEQWVLIGKLIDAFATAQRPLFSIGSSGIETALAAHWSAIQGSCATRFRTTRTTTASEWRPRTTSISGHRTRAAFVRSRSG